MRPRPAFVAALAVAALVACGDSDDADSSPPPPSPPAASPDEPAVTTERPRARRSGRGVRLSRVGRFEQPLYVTAPPGDRRRVFVVEKTGRIGVVRDRRKLSQPFLDLSGRVSTGSEQGLLSMAFAPDYDRSRRFYVSYTNRAGDSRIVEYRAAGPDRADPRSARVVLAVDQPEPNHNGGLVTFGPDDLLYIGLGDGGGADDRHGARGNGQSLGTLLGKILRIDPRRSGRRPYTVPRSNPFVGRRGARSEIYSYGLRNPWRFSFDRKTGDMTIGDVGQDTEEEIDFMPKGKAAGANFGWRVFEGRRRNYPGERARGAVAPVLTYSRSGGNCSVTGGYVVRDPRLPALRGRYVYGDYCVGRLFSVKLARGRASRRRALGLRVGALSSFGEDALGRVYATSLNGPVYRLVAK